MGKLKKLPEKFKRRLEGLQRHVEAGGISSILYCNRRDFVTTFDSLTADGFDTRDYNPFYKKCRAHLSGVKPEGKPPLFCLE